MVAVRPGVVLWFTGLSGAGKTTLAAAVYRELEARSVQADFLDGDALRALMPTGFTRADRDAHVLRTGFLASRLAAHGVTVLCALISPYDGTRRQVREQCAGFVEIHVSTPLEECERRDVKGLYKKARAGEITNFTGIDDPYEAPTDAELVVDTSRVSLDDAVERVLQLWSQHSGATVLV